MPDVLHGTSKKKEINGLYSDLKGQIRLLEKLESEAIPDTQNKNTLSFLSLPSPEKASMLDSYGLYTGNAARGFKTGMNPSSVVYTTTAALEHHSYKKGKDHMRSAFCKALNAPIRVYV